MSYLFAAYVVIWTLLFVYLVHLHRKQKELGRELERLSETMAGPQMRDGR